MKKLLPLLILAGFCVWSGHGQEDQRHASVIDRFDHLRILPPARIEVSTNGKTLEFEIVDKIQRRKALLDIDDDVRAPKGFGATDRKQLWWIYYCEEHKTAERSIGTVVILEPAQLNVNNPKGAKP